MLNDIAKVLDESVEKLNGIFERTDLAIERKKIEQKLEEARYDSGSVRPLADCIFSLFLAAKNRGYDVKSVLAELESVAQQNLEKSWKKMPDGTYQSF